MVFVEFPIRVWEGEYLSGVGLVNETESDTTVLVNVDRIVYAYRDTDGAASVMLENDEKLRLLLSYEDFQSVLSAVVGRVPFSVSLPGKN